MMRRAGLTLMELLVVISILATLAALLYPVYLSVRTKMYAVNCANQLRQIGLAIRMYAKDQGDDTPYSMPWGLGKLYPHYVNSKETLVCSLFQSIAPDVVEDMHQISQTRWGYPWTSYWEVCPKGLDEIARRNPDEAISFSEVYAKRGDQIPIAWCDGHRSGCPNSNYSFTHSPKGMDFVLRGGCGGAEIRHERGEIVVRLKPPPNPQAPLVVLRWNGSVSLVNVQDMDSLMLWY